MFKFDPVDAFLSAGLTLLGRMLLFFTAGMAGLALGWVAKFYDNWPVFSRPINTIGEAIGSGEAATAFTWLLLWPLVSLGTAAQPWFFVVFVLMVITVFAVLVYSEEPPFLWWLALVAMTSLVPAMSALSGWAISSWVVLGVFWLGLGSAALYFWRADYPGGLEGIERWTENEEPGDKTDVEETLGDSKKDS